MCVSIGAMISLRYVTCCRLFFFFSSRRRHTRCLSDWSSDVCSSDLLHRALITLRADLEKMGGSLVLLHRPATLPPFDAWGTLGDSLPLIKAVKHQLDPRSTLKDRKSTRLNSSHLGISYAVFSLQKII